MRRLQEDHAGFTVYFPFIVAESENVSCTRAIFTHVIRSCSHAIPRAPSTWFGRLPTPMVLPPRFWRVSRDSLRADWARHESP